MWLKLALLREFGGLDGERSSVVIALIADSLSCKCFVYRLQSQICQTFMHIRSIHGSDTRL